VLPVLPPRHERRDGNCSVQQGTIAKGVARATRPNRNVSSGLGGLRRILGSRLPELRPGHVGRVHIDASLVVPLSWKLKKGTFVSWPAEFSELPQRHVYDLATFHGTPFWCTTRQQGCCPEFIGRLAMCLAHASRPALVPTVKSTSTATQRPSPM